MRTLEEYIRENSGDRDRDCLILEKKGLIDKFLTWLLGDEDDEEYTDEQKKSLEEETKATEEQTEELRKEHEEFKKETEELQKQSLDALHTLEKENTPENRAAAKERLKVLCNRYIQRCQDFQKCEAEKVQIEEFAKKELEKYNIKWTDPKSAGQWLKKAPIGNIGKKGTA